VAHVGKAELRASAVEARLRSMPAFQRKAVGADVRRHVVEDVMVRDLLLAEEAARRGLEKKPGVRHRIDDALRRTLAAELGREIEAAGVPAADIERYYRAHVAEYQRPERIRLFRILVADEALARKIIGEVRGKDGLERWNRLARDHSLDASTKLRGGLLGFVGPNGHTSVPQLEVDPALHAAASKLKDGEVVPQPVKEGARFAVVWRRGTLPAVNRTLEDERDGIRKVLVRERLDARLAELVRELEKKHVRDVDPSPLEKLELPPAPGASSAPRNPHGVAPVDPVPRPTDHGLR